MLFIGVLSDAAKDACEAEENGERQNGRDEGWEVVNIDTIGE